MELYMIFCPDIEFVCINIFVMFVIYIYIYMIRCITTKFKTFILMLFTYLSSINMIFLVDDLEKMIKE